MGETESLQSRVLVDVDCVLLERDCGFDCYYGSDSDSDSDSDPNSDCDGMQCNAMRRDAMRRNSKPTPPRHLT
jgi:hypothetical protein